MGFLVLKQAVDTLVQCIIETCTSTGFSIIDKMNKHVHVFCKITFLGDYVVEPEQLYHVIELISDSFISERREKRVHSTHSR